ncbi:MAG TPA: hypothetical protein VGO60_17675 [Iamia sp.]|nr:hypothetical protein [Iamia sp.]
MVDWVHEHRNEILGFSALALGVWYPHRHAPAIRVGAALLALWVVVGLAVAATRWSRSIPASWCWRLGFGVGGSALAAIVVHELGAHQGRAVWAVISTVCFVPLVLALVGGHLAGIAAGAVSTGATVALAVGLVLGAEGAVWLGAALQGDVDGTRRVVPEVVVVEPSDPPVVVILDPPATAPTTVPPTAPPPAEPAEPISGPTRLTG